VGTRKIAIGDLLVALAPRLVSLSDTPALDAQVLLAQMTGKPRAWVLAHPEVELSRPQQAALEEALGRLESGEPLPYVLGHWEFFGLDFLVTPDVLIPRPETELLVATALAWLRAHADRRRSADIGAGCGCIAVALAVNVPDLRITATDISPKALKVAQRNAEKFNVANHITFIEADLLPPLPLSPIPYSLICANLPYIPTATLRGLPLYGREPTLALDGGADGLALIRRLLAEAPRRLAPGGLILLEIEASQGTAVLSLAYDAFTEAHIGLQQDLSGHDRLIRIEL